MEWLWRGMTYGKFPSMRGEEPVPTIEASSPITLAAVGESTPHLQPLLMKLPIERQSNSKSTQSLTFGL
jgi:hypothetical protein